MLRITLERGAKQPPLYLQIAERIRAMIISAELEAGYQLPSSRQLARELNLSRRTVVLAYEELCAQGFCLSQTGRGTQVAKIASLQQNNAALKLHSFPKWLATNSSLDLSVPDAEFDKPIDIDFAPGTTRINELSRKSMSQALKKSLHTIITQCPSFDRKSGNGHPLLLEKVCDYVLPMRGIKAQPNQVLITSGSQNGAALVSRLLASYGGAISYGVPGYLSIPWQFTSQGYKGLPCPVDEDGVQLSAKAKSARIHYVMPEHHFPTGVVMSPSRRVELLQLVEKQDALILEDDYDSEFYYDRHPLPALKSQDQGGRVIYLGSFSKILFNGLRLGYIVAHEEIIRQLGDLQWLINRSSNIISQLLVTELIMSGNFERHLRRMRFTYRHRRDLIAAHLQRLFPHWQWQLPQGGMQFWIKLSNQENADTVIRQWAQHGIKLHSAEIHYPLTSEESSRHINLGFAAVPESQIHEAFKRLSKSSKARNGVF